MSCVRVWRSAEADPGPFGGFVRLLLLTGQRLAKVAGMRWDDVGPDGVWRIRTEAREKGNAGDLPLPPIALEIIRSRPRIAGNPHIFAGRGDRPLSQFRYGKRKLDQSSGASGWVLHDMRRTARSLMSRAGVSSEHAERVLGHIIPGVEGVYDRHKYEREKGMALATLERLITTILAGQSGEVVPIRGRA